MKLSDGYSQEGDLTTRDDADTFNLTSRTLRCPLHRHWLRLRQLSATSGTVNFWACPELGCHHYRPCKYDKESLRTKLARRRVIRELNDLPLWSGNVVCNTRCTTA